MKQSISRSRWLIALQLPLTLLILVLVPNNFARVVALLVAWALTFKSLRRGELIFALIICVFFTGMNAASIEAGIFSFSQPDFLGQPWFELLMWGFYTLHTLRLIGTDAPRADSTFIWTIAVLYSACFPVLGGGWPLLAGTALLLAIGLARHHERRDWLFVGYFVAMGAAFEYTGVHAGLWHYPAPPFGGVPPWFITLWGGVGFFLHRLALPLLHRLGVYGASGDLDGRTVHHSEHHLP
ncbi:MAG: DUF2878 family protein [Rubrivivax sp.]|nr:MAG: DUF2878 family protein [Rubrivivax sp.]